MHRSNEFLLLLDLPERNAIESLVLPGGFSEQILHHNLTLRLQIPVLGKFTVHPVLEIRGSLFCDSGVASEVDSDETLGPSEGSAQLEYHHLIKPGVAEVEMTEVIVGHE